ncbi:MAG: hypothetical protein JWN30_876 [Bacilli bacterium]|nr:hypothetical protein [Bacilli bacterium]
MQSNSQDVQDFQDSLGSIQSWSDTQPAWTAKQERGAKGGAPSYHPNPSRPKYPPSTQYPNSRYPYSRYQGEMMNYRYKRAVPYDPRREAYASGTGSPSALLWQLTVSIALIVLVYCSYQSSQSWAEHVRAWVEFSMVWDYSANQVIHWFQTLFAQLNLSSLSHLHGQMMKQG